MAWWPKRSPKLAATRRAMMSTGPPGVKPCTMRIGLVGYSWADAGAAASNAAAIQQARRCNDMGEVLAVRAAAHRPPAALLAGMALPAAAAPEVALVLLAAAAAAAATATAATFLLLRPARGAQRSKAAD